jgi:dienelactone hydrolase
MKAKKPLHHSILISILILAGLGLGYLSVKGVHLTFLIPSLRNLLNGFHPVFKYTSQEIEFSHQNLKLKGSLYIPEGKGPFPGVVIAHGGTRLGRKLALYVVMGQKLAEKGYIALSFDFRGFGESEDPPEIKSQADLDFVGDLTQAVSTLMTVKTLDPQRIYLIGHSFGAGVVIQEGVRDPRVKKIISIAPGRRTFERFFGENAPEKDWPQIRISHDMKLPYLIPKDILYPILISFIAESILEFPQHPPLLFVDGSLEDPEDQKFLKDVYLKMTEPKDYVTIPGADHYFGTRKDESGFGRTPFYEEKVVREFIDTLDRWLRK